MASTVTEQGDPDDNVENTAETINQAIVTATTSQVPQLCKKGSGKTRNDSQSAGTEIQIVCETDTTAAHHGLLEANISISNEVKAVNSSSSTKFLSCIISTVPEATAADAQPPQSSLRMNPGYVPSKNIMKPSTSTKSESTEANMKCSQDASVTEKIINISPFPKSQTKRCGNRKRMKSEIISSSPYKCQLENANKQKAKPKLKLPKKSFKVPKKTQTKNVWTCVGCQEIYKEPIREDWIECSVCQEWWHEKCTGYLGFGEFKCDVCLQ